MRFSLLSIVAFATLNAVSTAVDALTTEQVEQMMASVPLSSVGGFASEHQSNIASSAPHMQYAADGTGAAEAGISSRQQQQMHSIASRVPLLNPSSQLYENPKVTSAHRLISPSDEVVMTPLEFEQKMSRAWKAGQVDASQHLAKNATGFSHSTGLSIETLIQRNTAQPLKISSAEMKHQIKSAFQLGGLHAINRAARLIQPFHSVSGAISSPTEQQIRFMQTPQMMSGAEQQQQQPMMMSELNPLPAAHQQQHQQMRFAHSSSVPLTRSTMMHSPSTMTSPLTRSRISSSDVDQLADETLAEMSGESLPSSSSEQYESDMTSHEMDDFSIAQYYGGGRGGGYYGGGRGGGGYYGGGRGGGGYYGGGRGGGYGGGRQRRW